jgi:outer membrane protein assembly factor BamB
MRDRLLVSILFLVLVSPARAQWHLRWSRELPQRVPAWKFTPRLPKDTAYEPVPYGDMILAACAHNGALIALDAKTGNERWRFYTNGPIRYAPVVAGERLCVGSDDGFLYCLDGQGRLQWKFRGGPSRRKVIGHGCLIAAWPVSSQPAVAGDTVCFSAGHWPTDGVFIHAVDTRTGEGLWVNDTAPIRPYGTMRIQKGLLFVECRGSGGAFDLSTGAARQEKRPRWEAPPLNATPSAVIGHVEVSVAAGACLVVSTTEGRIYCFGREKAQTRVHDLRKAMPAADTAEADSLLKATGVREGYALVVGLKDGGLLEGLYRQSKLHVIGIDADAQNVDAIRRRLDGRGLFDTSRLAVICEDPRACGLPPYMANLIVSETGMELSDGLFKSLRPYGGAFAQKRQGTWKLRKRSGPLAGAADWTHEFADAGNTLAVRETRVRAPLGLLWYGGSAADPRYYFNGFIEHDTRGHGVSPLPPNAEVVDGRMFLQAPDLLAAVDIYTGRVLWERSIPAMYNFGGPGGGLGIHSKKHPEPWKHPEALAAEVPPTHRCRASGYNYVTVSDGLYMATGKKLLRYRPEDGRLLSSWPVPLPGDRCWGTIRIEGNYLIATAFDPQMIADAQAGHDGNGGDWSKDRMRMSHLLVLNRLTGTLLWHREARRGFLNQGMAAGRGRIFCVDLMVEGVRAKLDEAGYTFPPDPPALYALDLKSGAQKWRHETDVLVKQLTYSAGRDILVAPCRNLVQWKNGTWVNLSIDARRGRTNKNAPGRMRGFRGTDGTLLWEVDEAPYFEPHIIVNDLIIDRYGWPYDLLSGKRAKRTSPLTGQAEAWGFRRGGCNHLIGCDTLITWRTAFYDLAGGSGVMPLTGMDAGCTPTFLPAGGVLVAGNFGTHYKRSRTTALALVHRPQNELWTTYASQKPRGSKIDPAAIRRAGFNFGAPGDRFDEDGTLWFSVTPRKREHVVFDPEDVTWYQLHPTRVDAWVAASGIRGATDLVIPAVVFPGKRPPRPDGTKRRYDVALYFAEVERIKPGERIFEVAVQGRPAVTDLDILKEAGGYNKVIVRTLRGVEAASAIALSLTPKRGVPVLSGVKITLRH